MKFKGTNFQSLQSFDLDLSGLTVIVGPSNKGKSAVFRALKGLFRNALPAEYIRTGSDGLELTAILDGHIIAATRGKGSTQYKIDAKEFKKLNQQIPTELSAFGMNEVEVGDFKIDPIFARQHGKQFLVDSEGYSPMELNTILGAFASTEKLEAGKKAANLEITHKNSEAKTLAEEVNASESRKASLEKIAVSASGIATRLQSLEPEVKVLEHKLYWLEQAAQRQSQLWPIQHCVSKLAVPDTAEVERVTKARDMAVQATNTFRIVRLCTKVREGLDFVNSAWDVSRTAYQQLRALNEYKDLLGSRVVFPVESLADSITASNQGFTALKSLTDSIILMAQYQTYMARSLDLAKQLTGVELEASLSSATIRDLQAQMKESEKIACPKCGERFALEE